MTYRTIFPTRGRKVLRKGWREDENKDEKRDEKKDEKKDALRPLETCWRMKSV